MRADLLKEICRVGEVAGRAESLEQIYEEAMNAVEHGLAAERQAVVLIDPDGVMRCGALRSLPERCRRAVEGVSPWSPATSTPQPVLINDTARESSQGPLTAVVAGVGIRSFAYLPLMEGGRLLGALALFYDTPHGFTNEEVHYAQSIASSVGFGIERHRDHQSLRLSEERLRRSQKMEAVGRLAGGVAHDFNNLLTAITGYADLLLARLRAGDPLRRHAEEIRKAAERATTLTSQLLAFSRQQVLQPKVLDLNTIIRNVGQMLHRLIGEHIELVMTLDPALGRVRADPGQIEQAITNLVVNARDAMPGGGRLTIATANEVLDDKHPREQLAATSPGTYATFSVIDTGCGMNAEVQSHLFEPFFTTKEQGRGTGLGLPTVYGIVKQSGGYIFVESQVGRGSTFQIYLPLVQEKAEVVDLAIGPGAGSIPRGTETILVVEDEDVVRELVREVLEMQGYNVLQASNADEAIAICRGHSGQIHMVLTDVVMPGLAGPALVDRLVALRPGLRSVLMSGYTESAVQRPSAFDPGTSFLQKPFTPESLAKKVRDVLDSAQGRGRL